MEIQYQDDLTHDNMNARISKHGALVFKSTLGPFQGYNVRMLFGKRYYSQGGHFSPGEQKMIMIPKHIMDKLESVTMFREGKRIIIEISTFQNDFFWETDDV